MLNCQIAAIVADALAKKAPIVALESTIITHGMPWPQNLDMAKSVESCVREAGATPATIAVIDGVLKIGLSAADLTQLAQTKNAAKLSRADLALCMAQKKTGATTEIYQLHTTSKTKQTFLDSCLLFHTSKTPRPCWSFRLLNTHVR